MICDKNDSIANQCLLFRKINKRIENINSEKIIEIKDDLLWFEELKHKIDDNLDAIHRSAKTLNALGKAMGDEIESQNKHLGRVIDKTDRVDTIWIKRLM